MKNNKYAPIVIFLYNRLEHTQKMIDSLLKNKEINESDIYIFCDGPKKENDLKVIEVQEYVRRIEKEGIIKNLKVYISDKNKGLAESVISGVSTIINKYGKIIVLEDDLILANNFLEYMNDSLKFFENNSKIWSISGYNIPIEIPKEYNKDIYLSYRGASWGWATWKNRWNLVDWDVKDYQIFRKSINRRKKFNKGGYDMSQMLSDQMDGRINSWAIRWCYEESNRNMFTVYPVRSLIKNIGLDGSGTHSGICKKYDIELNTDKVELENVEINDEILKRFKKFYYYGIKQKIWEYLDVIGLRNKILRIKRKNVR